MPNTETRQLIEQLFTVVRQLEARFPGRPFTPDGHQVGSLGEVIAAERYGLELMPPSTRGHDAIDADGRRVEIKATFGRRGVALRDNHADLLLVLRLSDDGSAEEVYHGPSQPSWDAAGKLQSNGQRMVSLAALRRLQEGRR